MSTRLDRLLLLLDSGSTPATRKAAALQIGEILKFHPQDLPNLLARVHSFLRSKNWDTRTAASQAIQAIAENIPKWDPPADPNYMEVKVENGKEEEGQLLFDSFSIERVLDKGSALLGSAGSEYDVDYDTMDPSERLAMQRKTLKSRLGLSFGGDMDFDIQDEDVAYIKSEKAKPGTPTDQSAVDITNELSGLSARERNRAKRLARIKAKPGRTKPGGRTGPKEEIDRPATPSIGGNVGPTLGHSIKKSRSMPGTPIGYNDDMIGLEYVDTDCCPFEAFCEELRHDLFSPQWEVRHGSGAALREILRVHGAGMGKVLGPSKEANQKRNEAWLEDAAIRLLCVFALDRFGDFVSDQVVAPVRETCAQALGVLLQHLPTHLVNRVLTELLQLQTRTTWEVRHGGLLGVKYIVAVRQDMAPQLLPRVLPAVLQGLSDKDDDVRAVSAEALLPIVGHVMSLAKDVVPELLRILWDTLMELDDLMSSTCSVMALLAELLSFPAVAEANEAHTGQSLTLLVPRLWAFFRHNNTAVRQAALCTLDKLLTATSHEPKWVYPILSDCMRHVFQNFLLDDKDKVLELTRVVWSRLLEIIPPQLLADTSARLVDSWLTLLITPAGMVLNSALLLHAVHKRPTQSGTNSNKKRGITHAPQLGPTVPVDGDQVIKLRLGGAHAIAMLATHWPSTNYAQLLNIFQTMLKREAWVSRLVSAAVIADWAHLHQEERETKLELGEEIINTLHTLINDPYMPNYEELEPIRLRLRSDAIALVHSFIDRRLDPTMLYADAGNPNLFNEDMASHLATVCYEKWAALCGDSPTKTVIEGSPRAICEGKHNRLQGTIKHLQSEQQKVSISASAGLVQACIALKALPGKLNPVIRPTMDALKMEDNAMLQQRSAQALAELMDQCKTRTPNPSEKITKNLANMTCVDTLTTPCISSSEGKPIKLNEGDEDELESESKLDGILSLEKQVRAAIVAAGPGGPGRKSKKPLDPDGALTDEQRAGKIVTRGAEFSLQALANYFQDRLLTDLPFFWTNLSTPIATVLGPSFDPSAHSTDQEAAQSLVNSLQPIRSVVPSLHSSLHPLILELLPCLFMGLRHPYKAVRYMCATNIAVMCQTILVPSMHAVVKDLLPGIADPTNIHVRQGTIEAIHCILNTLNITVVPYLVFLVVPVLGRMTDQNSEVRHLAAFCFAFLLKLMPLEAGMPNPEGMDHELAAQKIREREFLEQLVDTSKIKPVFIPTSIKVELRSYQQDGVNWMDFLRRYNLHGVLGDDMGLGKTIQAICIMAVAHAEQAEKGTTILPHLVVSPPTLTGHWFYEIKKFSDKMNPLQYMGSPSERLTLREQIPKHDIILISYDILRNEIDFFKNIQFSYCILDEGHIIKSAKAKVTKATKIVQCNHRLLLSGTPIQNNVLELWSLFDFLMPGFLGTSRQFNESYSKPINASRDAKATSKDSEAGVLAMESLHRQVLPFMLRRVKDDVLKDLPPKIIQDYYCDLSPMQRRLYEDFSCSNAKNVIEQEAFAMADVEDGEEGCEKRKKESNGSSAHIFQALQYLRKVCTHPLLVLTPSHPEYSALKSSDTDLHALEHAPKLVALRQLLLDCGIGVAPGEGGGLEENNVCQHRVLLFCQLKSMLDLVESDLLAAHLPRVTYLRLDGDTDASQRYDVVQKFNSDPTIDMLLLTTHVGGLGLNLTGADTVIFLEHDWNPMKDMQAMDRAHRIGQKKVVNVYRLITKDTMEEKVMGLQKFKLNIANTVVTMDNSSLKTMDTSQLLDLFSLEDKAKAPPKPTPGKGIKSLLENIEDLWEETQYEEEYNLDSFVASLN